MKKSQAALEFLTTYGWALLMILIIIAAIAYFGVFSPKKILPSRCLFSSEINCIDYSIAYGTDGTDGTVRLKLKNSVGDSISIDSMALKSDSIVQLACTPPSITAWPADETKDLEWTACNTGASGSVKGKDVKLFLTMEYHILKSTSNYKRAAEGEILTTVT